MNRTATMRTDWTKRIEAASSDDAGRPHAHRRPTPEQPRDGVPMTDPDDDEDDAPPQLPGGKFYMTPEGHRRLLDEFRRLRSEERPRVVEIVSWAAGNGDRSENADYKEGKRRLREIDRRLRFLDRRLRHAEVVDPASQANRAQVFFGATVTFANERDDHVTVTIVGADEADLAAGKISIASPVALAMLRARQGDEVSVRTPHGPEVIEILDIVYPTPTGGTE
jgi:transcription elongation factor GreB